MRLRLGSTVIFVISQSETTSIFITTTCQKTIRVADTTVRIVASFRRDDVRIRGAIASKYGQRRIARNGHLLHNVTKTIVTLAVKRRETIVLEDIRGIRCLYRKGNGQTRKYRSRMNGWSFGEAQRQIEYKARWSGLPITRLSRRETRGSSVTCPRCGERLQSDKRLARKLWCGKCRIVMDRDMVAAVSLARRGRVRFARSRPPILLEAQGGAVEAVKTFKKMEARRCSGTWTIRQSAKGGAVG